MVLGTNTVADYLRFIAADFKKNKDIDKLIRRIKIKEMHLTRKRRFDVVWERHQD